MKNQVFLLIKKKLVSKISLFISITKCRNSKKNQIQLQYRNKPTKCIAYRRVAKQQRIFYWIYKTRDLNYNFWIYILYILKKKKYLHWRQKIMKLFKACKTFLENFEGPSFLRELVHQLEAKRSLQLLPLIYYNHRSLYRALMK